MAAALSARIARPQTFGTKSRFLGQPLKIRTAVALPNSRQQVSTKALFGFGAGKTDSKAAAATTYNICIDCGYIYDNSAGAFKELPSSYRCPKCNSPKNRFKVFKGEVKGKPNNAQSAMTQRMKEKKW